MAKRSTKTAPKKVDPKFKPGEALYGVSLVVDMHGVAWWVDPVHQRIKRAEVEK